MKILYSLSFAILFLLSGTTCFAQVPVISTFTPAKEAAGNPVTITGSGFNTTLLNNVVFFGATKAVVSAATATSLTVTVPKGATFQPISVLNTVNRLMGYSATPFIPIFSTHNSIGAADIDPAINFTTGGNPVAVAAADMDGDGNTDVVSLNGTANTFSVLVNNASGNSVTANSFSAKTDVATLNNPTAFSIADLNGDGKPDVAVVYQLTNTLSIFINNSTFTAPSTHTIAFLARLDYAIGSNANALAIGDLNKDGKPDIVTANFTANTISIMRNATSAAGTFLSAAKIDFATGEAPNSISLADIDKSGKMEIIVGNFTGKTVSVLKNNAGTSQFIATSFAPKVDFTVGGQPTAVYAADIDMDGWADLVVANYHATRNVVSVFRNAGIIGIAATSFTAPVDFTTGSQPTSLALGDIDGDGKPDIAAADYNAKSITILRNNSVSGTIAAASLNTKIDFLTGNTPYSLTLGDIDGDGKPDLLSANDIDNTVSVLHNYNAASVIACQII